MHCNFLSLLLLLALNFFFFFFIPDFFPSSYRHYIHSVWLTDCKYGTIMKCKKKFIQSVKIHHLYAFKNKLKYLRFFLFSLSAIRVHHNQLIHFHRVRTLTHSQLVHQWKNLLSNINACGNDPKIIYVQKWLAAHDFRDFTTYFLKKFMRRAENQVPFWWCTRFPLSIDKSLSIVIVIHNWIQFLPLAMLNSYHFGSEIQFLTVFFYVLHIVFIDIVCR